MTTSLRSPSFSWSSSSLSSKMMPWTTVILLFFFCGPSLVSCMCPRVCRCSLDHAGHKLVICDQGGMLESIPATQMEYDIWKLVVTAPPNNLNNLAISRIFYRFTQLREIHITNSLLPAIGDETFKGLYKLQVSGGRNQSFGPPTARVVIRWSGWTYTILFLCDRSLFSILNRY